MILVKSSNIFQIYFSVEETFFFLLFIKLFTQKEAFLDDKDFISL